MVRLASLWVWCFAVWLVLTWTISLEQELFGAGVALVVAFAISRLGAVIRPWAVLHPRRLAAVPMLLLEALGRVLVANVKLAYRVWAPSRPLRSGMVIVPTEQTTDAGLTAVGLITSVIVDNQIVDLDRGRRLLQYHAVAVPEGDREEKRAHINGPVERFLRPLIGGGGK
jgi:multicomponent Na+:H+ antiporter subunit E